MEHRWEKRCPVSLDVVVRGHDGLTLQGRTRDISLDGMFIQLGRRSVSMNTVVEMRFHTVAVCALGCYMPEMMVSV